MLRLRLVRGGRWQSRQEWGQPVTVATKCGVLPNEDRTPNRFTSRATILEEVEGSLKRLQTDCIDLYQLHWPEPDESVEEAWQTLLDLQQQGKIKWAGVSNYSAQLQRATALGPVSSLQPAIACSIARSRRKASSTGAAPTTAASFATARWRAACSLAR